MISVPSAPPPRVCPCSQVHGTCLGFEALAVIVSGNASVLSDMDAENAPAPLLYTDQADSSDWLQALPPHLVRNLQDQPLAMENHMHGEGPGRGYKGSMGWSGSRPHRVCS